MFGVLLVDKPQGLSSHDVVNRVRRKFGTRRVGHAGTLDPLATGLLVVAVGPATRFLQYMPLEPKEYVADISFGIETDSYDADGNVVAEHPVPENLAEAYEEAKRGFLGLIQQVPPMFSAIKKNGKPLYLAARQGIEVEREARNVHIGLMELIAVEGNVYRVRIVCSGGTYIRSLAHDLGRAIGCGAHLTALRRTGVGKFRVEEAAGLEEAEAAHIKPLREALPPMPLVALDSAQTAHIREGRAIIHPVDGEPRLVALLDADGHVFSVARVQGNVLHPECVIPSEAPHVGR